MIVYVVVEQIVDYVVVEVFDFILYGGLVFQYDCYDCYYYQYGIVYCQYEMCLYFGI